jgi:hypothetical protein
MRDKNTGCCRTTLAPVPTYELAAGNKQKDTKNCKINIFSQAKIRKPLCINVLALFDNYLSKTATKQGKVVKQGLTF